MQPVLSMYGGTGWCVFAAAGDSPLAMLRTAYSKTYCKPFRAVLSVADVVHTFRLLEGVVVISHSHFVVKPARGEAAADAYKLPSN